MKTRIVLLMVMVFFFWSGMSLGEKVEDSDAVFLQKLGIDFKIVITKAKIIEKIAPGGITEFQLRGEYVGYSITRHVDPTLQEKIYKIYRTFIKTGEPPIFIGWEKTIGWAWRRLKIHKLNSTKTYAPKAYVFL